MKNIDEKMKDQYDAKWEAEQKLKWCIYWLGAPGKPYSDLQEGSKLQSILDALVICKSFFDHTLTIRHGMEEEEKEKIESILQRFNFVLDVVKQIDQNVYCQRDYWRV